MSVASFSKLPISADLISTLSDLNYVSMTPIQQRAILPLLLGKDIIGQAKTGSGKTLAFALPTLNKIDLVQKNIQALILSPTRELGQQVAREFRKLAKRKVGLHVITLFGGQPARMQAESLYHGAHVAIATPGRLVDLIQRQWIDLRFIQMLVIDEADELLDLGFEEDMHFILDSLPEKKQIALFSATFPEKILRLSQQFQKSPEHLHVLETTTSTSASKIKQLFYKTSLAQKNQTLQQVLIAHPASSVLIFCNQKITARELADSLSSLGASCDALHGDLEQHDRDQVMAMFRNSSLKILIATDVAARGLDIEDLALVINFDLPQQAETYLHRIGRTGRANREGLAISLAAPYDEFKISELQKNHTLELAQIDLVNPKKFSISAFRSLMRTIEIAGGRKDKLRPGDIVGALTGDVGLEFKDIGKIEIHDRNAFVAISFEKASSALQKLKICKLKGKKFLVRLI
jgi:ATP-dependent RNA helicase DbpA